MTTSVGEVLTAVVVGEGEAVCCFCWSAGMYGCGMSNCQ